MRIPDLPRHFNQQNKKNCVLFFPGRDGGQDAVWRDGTSSPTATTADARVKLKRLFSAIQPSILIC
jgi:hypothetical protein